MNGLPPITVAICTFRRESVVDAIRSVDRQMGVALTRILIIDNDDTPSAEKAVSPLLKTLRSPLTYIHQPGRNISIARNRALDEMDGSLLAFIDDDEIAAPGWLGALADCLHAGSPRCHGDKQEGDKQDRDSLAAVFGPVTPTYPSDAPGWMTELTPHAAEPVIQDGTVKAGYAGNCLLNLDHPAFDDLRFDEGLGRTGGEDTAFFYEAYKKGATYAVTADADVTEDVPPSRASFGWLWQRRFDAGVRLHQLGLLSGALAPLKILYCGLGAVRHSATLGPRSAALLRGALLRGALHLGALAAAFGQKSSVPYGQTHPARDFPPGQK